MKKIKMHRIGLILTIALITIAMLGASTAFASQQQQPQYQGMYTVRWPDGTTQVFNDLETAKQVADSWKELDRGTTDKDGNLTLPNWISKGEIKIKEIQPPKGYVIDGDNEVTKFVKDKTVTFTNRKAKGFLIRKMDQNRNPLSGVTFEVKAKPVLKVEREVIIQKLHVSDAIKDYDDKVFNPGPFRESIAIHIEGPDTDVTFSPNRAKNSITLSLKPGTYKVNEIIPAVGEETLLQEEKVYIKQSFLTNYEFTVGEDGKITSSDGEKWGWLREGYNEDSILRDFVDKTYDSTDNKVSVEGNVITITNHTVRSEIQQESQVQE